MRILYCDCFSGISGDMFLAGLLDAGLPVSYLVDQLATLKLPEPFSIESQLVHKGPISARLLQINFGESLRSEWRHLADIETLIESSSLPEKVKITSLDIFRRLAEAEARVHGSTIEEVHFHEVGAIDSLIDIVGAAIGLDYLKIGRVYASALPLGSGQVQTRHGLLPVPAPATLELMRNSHMKVVASNAQTELVTPTGAAILAALATFQTPSMTIELVGIGAGRKDFPWPNILRLIIGEESERDQKIQVEQTERMVQIETNIDDMNPQIFGYVLNKLFSSGALDVYFTPIYMKKNRPATMLSIIARHQDEENLAKVLLEETTTFGMRIMPIYRYEAERSIVKVQTIFGEISVKMKIINGKIHQVAPEYEDCYRLSQDQRVPLIRVYQTALAASQSLLSS